MQNFIGHAQYYQNPYKNQWESLYPGRPFPTPQSNPQMFPQGAQTKTVIYYYNPFSMDCTVWQTCPKGLIDYQCNWNHSCYLNLISLAIHLIGFFLAATFIIAVCGKLLTFAYHFLTSIFFVHRAIAIITSVLKCFSFGMLDRDVIVEVQQGTTKKLTDKHLYIKQKLQQIDLQVNFEALDNFQLKRIADILDDYEIQDEIEEQQKPILNRDDT